MLFLSFYKQENITNWTELTSQTKYKHTRTQIHTKVDIGEPNCNSGNHYSEKKHDKKGVYYKVRQIHSRQNFNNIS